MPEQELKKYRYRGLGLDPGLAKTGFAVIGCRSRGGSLCDWGTVTTKPGMPGPQRLQEIYRGVSELLQQWRPDIIGIEDVYVLDAYPRAAIQLGEVKGVIALAAADAQVALMKIKPTEVKHGLTGSGRATKLQVQQSLQQALGLRHAVTPDHASDAAALALMALSRSGLYNW